MMNSLSLFVGLRYVRARSHKFFVSFITWVSLLCVCLGVAALIVILSAMNGLEGSLRDGLLSLTSHARVYVAPEAPAPDWKSVNEQIRATPDVVSTAPFIELEALAVRKPDMLPVRLRGIDPENPTESAKIGNVLLEGALTDLAPGTDRVLIGRNMAIQMGLGLGDTLTVLVPITDANGMPEPRLRELTVAGVFDTTSNEFDSLLISSLDDVAALLPNAASRLSLYVNFSDALLAPDRARALAAKLPAGVEIRDWAEDHASYFRAIRLEKTMVAIILMLIVAVAAFYLVAMLAMVVTDKRTDIAILRTLGTAPGQIMKMFLIQGGVIAWLGVALGVALGCLVGHFAGAIAAFLERLFRFEFFDSSVYVTTRIPSELRAEQVLWIAAIAMLITIAATIYPAWRASRVPPADALRYE